MELHIPVFENFSLFAGIAEKKGDLMTIYPPEKSLFDQLCTWLDQRPSPTVGYNHWVFSIGATALCLRWGSYLAVLMDKTKPVLATFLIRAKNWVINLPLGSIS